MQLKEFYVYCISSLQIYFGRFCMQLKEFYVIALAVCKVIYFVTVHFISITLPPSLFYFLYLSFFEAFSSFLSLYWYFPLPLYILSVSILKLFLCCSVCLTLSLTFNLPLCFVPLPEKKCFLNRIKERKGETSEFSQLKPLISVCLQFSTIKRC